MEAPPPTPAISAELRSSRGAVDFNSQETWSCKPGPRGGRITENVGHLCLRNRRRRCVQRWCGPTLAKLLSIGKMKSASRLYYSLINSRHAVTRQDRSS